MKASKKKTAKTKSAAVPLLKVSRSKPEKPYVERVHDEIRARLRNLHEGIFASPEDGEKERCVEALVDAAMFATNTLQSLYGSGSEDQRQLVRQVALRGEKFIGIYNFRLPSALRDEPRSVETRGDEMRRELTKDWQALSPLKVSEKTEHDALRLVLEGFVKAVLTPSKIHHEPSDKPSLALDLILESQGVIFISPEVRATLLEPEAKGDATTWAKAFVKWYESHHPLPSNNTQDDSTTSGAIYREIVEQSRRNRLGKKIRAFKKRYGISPARFLELTDDAKMEIRDMSARGKGEQLNAAKATRVTHKANSISGDSDSSPTKAEFRAGLYEAALVRLKKALRK